MDNYEFAIVIFLIEHYRKYKHFLRPRCSMDDETFEFNLKQDGAMVFYFKTNDKGDIYCYGFDRPQELCYLNFTLIDHRRFEEYMRENRKSVLSIDSLDYEIEYDKDEAVFSVGCNRINRQDAIKIRDFLNKHL